MCFGVFFLRIGCCFLIKKTKEQHNDRTTTVTMVTRGQCRLSHQSSWSSLAKLTGLLEFDRQKLRPVAFPSFASALETLSVQRIWEMFRVA